VKRILRSHSFSIELATVDFGERTAFLSDHSRKKYMIYLCASDDITNKSSCAQTLKEASEISAHLILLDLFIPIIFGDYVKYTYNLCKESTTKLTSHLQNNMNIFDSEEKSCTMGKYISHVLRESL
jgi:hypothetical protein